MLRYLLVLMVIGLWIYTFIDCLTTPDEKVRNLPKVIWVIIILIFGGTLLLGPVAWLVAGRPRVGAVDHRKGEGREQQTLPRPEPRRFVAPDDNPEFLASLNKADGPGQGPEEPNEPSDTPKDSDPSSPDSGSGSSTGTGTGSGTDSDVDPEDERKRD